MEIIFIMRGDIMGIKELREKFHDQDKNFSSHFHSNDQNGVKKPSWGEKLLLHGL